MEQRFVYLKSILMKKIMALASFVFICLLTSCTKDDERVKSSEKEIISFAVLSASDSVKVDINHTQSTIAVSVPFGTDVKSLTPTIQLPGFTAVTPASGVAQDFSAPVKYTVTAEDGSKKEYTVAVTVLKGNLTGKWFLYENTLTFYDDGIFVSGDSFSVAKGSYPARELYFDFKAGNTLSVKLQANEQAQTFPYSITSDSTMNIGVTDIAELKYKFLPNQKIVFESKNYELSIPGRYSIEKFFCGK